MKKLLTNYLALFIIIIIFQIAKYYIGFENLIIALVALVLSKLSWKN